MSGPDPTAPRPELPAIVGGFRILRRWLCSPSGLAALACVIAAILVPLVLSYRGFCFSERRFLSEQEYIDAWVDRLIGSKRHTLRVSRPGSVELRSVDVIPYQDRSDFYRRNPGCCQTLSRVVGDDLPPLGFLDKLCGTAARIVSATYTVNHIDTDGLTKNTTATALTWITNCGRPWRGI
jgi:hypothetical protein